MNQIYIYYSTNVFVEIVTMENIYMYIIFFYNREKKFRSESIQFTTLTVRSGMVLNGDKFLSK